MALGTITSQKRRDGEAPSDAAPSSSVLTSTVEKTAITDRTMNGIDEGHVTGQDKEPRPPKIAEAAIGEQQRERDSEPGIASGRAIISSMAPTVFRLGRAAREPRGTPTSSVTLRVANAMTNDSRMVPDVEDLDHPSQCHPRLDTLKVIHRNAGGDRPDRRHDQECGNNQRKEQLSGENQAVTDVLIPPPQQCRR